jgi:hypothetical protein
VGDGAFWSKSVRAGRYELHFEHDGKFFSLDIATRPAVQFSEPRKLDFDPFSLGLQRIESLPDGRFLVIRAPDSELGASELHLVLNWTERLARQVPVSRE